MRKTLTALLCVLLAGCSAQSNNTAETEAEPETEAETETTAEEEEFAPSWIADVPAGEKVTTFTAEELDAYFAKYIDDINMFDVYTFENSDKEVGDITYYLYDPTEHGYEKGGNYPVVMWFHGGGNGREGSHAVFAAGAAGMAEESVQADIGGMYVICPLANEEEGEYGLWSEGYVESLHTIYDNVVADNNITGPKFIAGTSMGGLMCDFYAAVYHSELTGIFWMSTTIPDAETVKSYSDEGIRMWFEVSTHDETGAFNNSFGEDGNTAPFEEIENFELTKFDWIRYGDKTIASLNAGMEFGQHCSCLQANRNFIFDDGTPDDPAHPDGISGWFRDVINSKN